MLRVEFKIYSFADRHFPTIFDLSCAIALEYPAALPACIARDILVHGNIQKWKLIRFDPKENFSSAKWLKNITSNQRNSLCSGIIGWKKAVTGWKSMGDMESWPCAFASKPSRRQPKIRIQYFSKCLKMRTSNYGPLMQIWSKFEDQNTSLDNLLFYIIAFFFSN